MIDTPIKEMDAAIKELEVSLVAFEKDVKQGATLFTLF